MSFTAPEWYYYPALVVALVTGVTATLLLRAAPRQPANQFLAFFLFLICGNFAAQFFIGAYRNDPADQRQWEYVGLLFLIWDPATLVYFASVFPQRSFFATRRWAFSLLAATPTIFTLLFFADPESFRLPHPWPKRLLILYMALAYAYCLLVLLFSRIPPETTARRQQTLVMTLGFSVALIPRFGLIADDLGLFAELAFGAYGWRRTTTRVGIALGVFILLWAISRAYARRHPGEPPRGYQVPFVFRWTLFFLLLTVLFWILGSVAAYQGAFSARETLNLYYPLRWILFALIVGYAIAKFQVFDVEIRFKRFLGRLAVFTAAALAFGAGYFGLNLVLPKVFEDPRAASALLSATLAVLVALATRHPLARLTDLLLPRVAADESYVRGRKLEVYGAHLEAAAAEGRLRRTPDALLESVRLRLGITMEEHHALERLLRRSTTPPKRLEDRIASGDPLFGRYRVLQRLDAGAFADVFLADDLERRARVVLKRLHPGFGQDESVLKSFLREAEVAGRVQHPNVVPVHEVLRDGPDAYLVLDFVEGGNLQEFLSHSGARPVSEAARIARDLLNGLEAVHRLAVYHRDLKPSNILLSRDGRALITDFGVAHVPNLEKTGSTLRGAPPGTVAYMSPEQALGRPVDGRADTYAVGALLFELTTARPLHPWKGLGEFELRQRVARGVPKTQLQQAPKELRIFLGKALAREPSDRFQTPAEMLEALNQAVPTNGE